MSHASVIIEGFFQCEMIGTKIIHDMIIWNCQKVNSSNSALKPLPRNPDVPKVGQSLTSLDNCYFENFDYTDKDNPSDL